MRSFLEFKLEGIFSNIRGGRVSVTADLSGGLVFLASITFMDFAKRIGKHCEIAETDSVIVLGDNLHNETMKISENEKLRALSELWRDISPEIGGYLFGDTDEVNPDPAIPCSECDCGQCS